MTRLRTRATLGAIVLSTAALGALSACGGPADPTVPATPPARTPATASSPPAPSGEVWTSATVLQRDPAAPPELCLGAVAQSYPPQCGGPRILGWDWGEVAGETEASGVTWIDTVHVTGTYDGDTFTLTRPPSALPPAGAVVETPAATDFPELCDDPMRGAGASAAAGIRADERAKDALARHLESMDGYVASWVSDGTAFMNVVVTGDPERTHAEARRLWAGKLCVDQRDVATHADLLAAQEALADAPFARHQCLGSSPGADGRLHVGVILADPDTVAAVHRAVAPWLAPDDVVLASRLRPLDG